MLVLEQFHLSKGMLGVAFSDRMEYLFVYFFKMQAGSSGGRGTNGLGISFGGSYHMVGLGARACLGLARRRFQDAETPAVLVIIGETT